MAKLGQLGTLLACAALISTAAAAAAGKGGEKDNKVRDALAEIDDLKEVVATLTRQLSQQQLFVEERIRSEGSSGVKQLREKSKSYNKPFYGNSYTGSRYASIHDHANYERTVGMGEIVAVLNGVEFRTRHNDYKLKMASTTSKAYHALEDVPLPDVPPQVLSKKTVAEQIEEMKLWFKAWKDQDYSKRDYRKYFKPALCYLEGAWTSSGSKIDEPFDSDRHQVDADNWFDLQEKVRFTSHTGRKSDSENFAFLPTTIMGMTNESKPILAQWNYRILCHPLKTEVPLSRLRVVDDIMARKAQGKDLKSFAGSRAARFSLSVWDRVTYKEGIVNGASFLDKLMMEIPGKDNYMGDVADNAFGSMAVDLKANFRTNSTPPHLNTAYYHRFYKTTGKDAMGLAIRRRGYSDPNLFVALNTQPKVAPVKVTYKSRVKVGNRYKKMPVEHTQRVSYAIPLELIYLTPLYKWNPYNLEMRGTQKSSEGRVATANGRNGGKTNTTAYNGVNGATHYITPVELFTGTKTVKDSADTTKGSVGVLDRDGNVRYTAASGTRIFLPSIGDLGPLRTRFPIAPVHEDGDAVWKEVAALKDIVLDGRLNAKYYNHPLTGSGSLAPDDYENEMFTFQLAVGTKDPPGPHVHQIELSGLDISMLKNGTAMTVFTDEVSGHNHELRLAYSANRQTVRWTHCDGQRTRKCWDGHTQILQCLDCPEK